MAPLSSLPLLQTAPADFRAEFERNVVAISLPTGHPICHQGNRCQHLPLLLTGQARVFKLGENGRELTLYRIYPGESCVLTASCMLSDIPFPAEAVTESEVKAVAVPTARALAWFERFPHWRHFIFGMVSHRLADILSLVEEVTFRRMDSRLAGHLLRRGERGALQQTHQQIADELGSAREVVSRLLKDFEARGLIQVGRGRIELLDSAGLENLAAG